MQLTIDQLADLGTLVDLVERLHTNGCADECEESGCADCEIPRYFRSVALLSDLPSPYAAQVLHKVRRELADALDRAKERAKP